MARDRYGRFTDPYEYDEDSGCGSFLGKMLLVLAALILFSGSGPGTSTVFTILVLAGAFLIRSDLTGHD